MIEVNPADYWRSKAGDYEHLYHEQKNICDGYRQIIRELMDIKTKIPEECKENIRKIEQNVV